jgi:hypothetical protein
MHARQYLSMSRHADLCSYLDAAYTRGTSVATSMNDHVFACLEETVVLPSATSYPSSPSLPSSLHQLPLPLRCCPAQLPALRHCTFLVVSCLYLATFATLATLQLPLLLTWLHYPLPLPCYLCYPAASQMPATLASRQPVCQE